MMEMDGGQQHTHDVLITVSYMWNPHRSLLPDKIPISTATVIYEMLSMCPSTACTYFSCSIPVTSQHTILGVVSPESSHLSLMAFTNH
jgi:hypothetical protein